MPNASDDDIQDTSNAEEVILIDANEVDNNVDADADEVVNDEDNNKTNEMVNNDANVNGIANGTNQVIENKRG